MKTSSGEKDRYHKQEEWHTTDALRERLDRLRGAIDHLLEGFQIIDRDWRYVYVNPAAARHARTTVDDMLGRTMSEVHPEIESTEMFLQLKRCMSERASARFENQFTYQHGGTGWFEFSVEPVPEGLCVLSVDITERKRAETELDRRLSELEVINRLSTAMRSAQTLEEMLPRLLDEALDVLHLPQGIIWLYDSFKNELRPVVTRGYGLEEGRPAPPPERPGEGFAGRALTDGEPVISKDLHLDERLPERTRGNIPPGFAAVTVAIRTSEGSVGAFTVGDRAPHTFTPDELDLLTTMVEIAGNAIHRMRLHEETARRLRRISALREIDLAITTSFDLRRNLRTILEQVSVQLEVDAAAVLLLRKDSGHLRFAGGHGFRHGDIESTNLRIGEGAAGTAASQRTTVHVSDLREAKSFVRRELARREGFITYHCTPLITRGEVIGVLEVFHRRAVERNQEWIDFLNALAGQTAIAVEVSTLFDELQRSSNELSMAYDATIEGWSRALDLRDRETEGHTLRVTELTVRLAKASGLSESDLVHVRWGALLHDIGKMGVPDAILLKPGPLTEEEWLIMKRHPVFAFEMLSPIRYLRNAIEIPYCHHEKWDGSGYPRGLKREQIPIEARLFAVVDVWDALRSDRPYRKAWSEGKVREHIKSLSGTHFDPRAVEIFLEVTEH